MALFKINICIVILGFTTLSNAVRNRTQQFPTDPAKQEHLARHGGSVNCTEVCDDYDGWWFWYDSGSCQIICSFDIKPETTTITTSKPPSSTNSTPSIIIIVIPDSSASNGTIIPTVGPTTITPTVSPSTSTSNTNLPVNYNRTVRSIIKKTEYDNTTAIL